MRSNRRKLSNPMTAEQWLASFLYVALIEMQGKRPRGQKCQIAFEASKLLVEILDAVDLIYEPIAPSTNSMSR